MGGGDEKIFEHGDELRERLASAFPWHQVGSCEDHPEGFQLETGGTRIFINVADARLVQVLDRESGEIVASWPLPEGLSDNFPMHLDESSCQLLVGVEAV